MSLIAWVTFIGVTLILYGGFAWCLVVAYRRSSRGPGGDEE
jgi:hypothetical protein